MRCFWIFLAVALAAAFSTWAQPDAPHPNVLLLSVDTLRADRLGCYGHPLPTSPNLDRLASEGIRFENMICEIPLTNPSFGAMLSSRYPRATGTTRNGLPMPGALPLATERFQAAGYATFSVQSNWTLKKKLSGLDRGFDTYDDGFHEKRWGFLKPERGGKQVTDRALALLAEQRPDRPFFAWVHYSDPHAPYELHKDFNVHQKKTWRLNKEEKVRARYDSEVAFTDAQIGRLLQALPENTYVVFVGDHGESLYEHDYLGHGRRVHQTNLHVPLILHGPGIEAARSSLPVRGVDVGPTLLALAGLEPLPDASGLPVLSGAIAPDRVRVVETYGGAVPNLPGAKALMAGAGAMRQAVLSNGWKLIADGRKEQLFHLPQDPGELTDLHVQEAAQTERLRGLLTAWDQAVVPVKGGDGAALTQDDVDALRSLGYVE
ncbi:MAG: sulfatase [Candidatus Hydrogenedentes bacterium]|nr:sulfatase [Candidatus Hydrogenedentota bacterium]